MPTLFILWYFSANNESFILLKFDLSSINILLSHWCALLMNYFVTKGERRCAQDAFKFVMFNFVPSLVQKINRQTTHYWLNLCLHVHIQEGPETFSKIRRLFAVWVITTSVCGWHNILPSSVKNFSRLCLFQPTSSIPLVVSFLRQNSRISHTNTDVGAGFLAVSSWCKLFAYFEANWKGFPFRFSALTSVNKKDWLSQRSRTNVLGELLFFFV